MVSPLTQHVDGAISPTDIDLSVIQTDGGTQMRAKIHKEVCLDYRDQWLAGAEFDPIVVFHDGSAYWLADGFHRFYGAREAKLKTIPAQVRQGSQRDAILYAAGANATHGLRRSNADKRRVVEALLNDEEWVQWSDRKIAESAAVGVDLVGTVRRQLSETDSSSPAAKSAGNPRVGRDGKTRRSPQKSAGKTANKDNGEPDKLPDAAIVLDATNRPVPTHLAEKHGTAAAIQAVGSKLDAIKRDALALCDEPGGVFIDRDEVEQTFKRLKSLFTQARYWSECPRCKGEISKTCDKCDGHGFLPFSRRGQLSDADKEWLGVS